MPQGFTGTKRKNTEDTEAQIARYRAELLAHDEELRRRGHDPQYIGSNEVEPVRCTHCRNIIPWSVLKGYARTWIR
jgi:hypothetical protein